MKRGEQILLAIGTLWTVGLLSALSTSSFSRDNVLQASAIILIIWTVLGLIWVFVYGRRE